LPVKTSRRCRTRLLGSLPLLQEQGLLTLHQTSSPNRRTQSLMILHDHPAANVGLQTPDELRSTPLLATTDVGRKLLKLHKSGLIIHHRQRPLSERQELLLQQLLNMSGKELRSEHLQELIPNNIITSREHRAQSGRPPDICAILKSKSGQRNLVLL